LRVVEVWMVGYLETPIKVSGDCVFKVFTQVVSLAAAALLNANQIPHPRRHHLRIIIPSSFRVLLLGYARQ